MIYFIVLGILFVIFLFLGFRIVRPTHRGLVERLGKYNHFAEPGFNWIIPFIDHMYQDNAKIIVPANSDLVNVIGDLAGANVVPLNKPVAK